MTSARQQAIEAMKAIVRHTEPCAVSVEALLDAIPPGVLAQLAIDRGGLQQCGYSWRESLLGSQVTHHWKPSCNEPYEPVYRLTEETP